MVLLRTDEMMERYREHQKSHPVLTDTCPLCSKPSIQEFTYWKIMVNDFPYDLIASEHHMILPKRHVPESSLTAEEVGELVQIKPDLDKKYDFIVEATFKNKSIPAHHHLHLLVIKDFKVV